MFAKLTESLMQPVAHRRWQQRLPEPPDPHLVDLFSQSLNITPLAAHLLLQRNILTLEDARYFLQASLSLLPDPELLPQMTVACERLYRALIHQEKIAIHGDYDVDGISGCALLVEILRNLGADVEYHIPLRLAEGYGLSAEAIRGAAQRGCTLLVSVDCGVSAHAEAELAQELGLDLIITDHHQPGTTLPVCLALINPHLPVSDFPYQDLSGVGVAFFLMAGLRRYLRNRGYFATFAEPDLRCCLDLVALGTIADIVPLTGVNRILVRAGLRLLNTDERNGIRALKTVAGVKEVTCGAVGFRLAPRLNAAGRLEDAALGVKLLLENEQAQLNALAATLDEFNRERQALEQKTLDEAIACIEEQNSPQRRSIVLAAAGWHSGVIGIVASRLVERYHRPVVLIALTDDGLGKGSARSVRGFHLYQALHQCAELLDGFGGHAMAAGLTIGESQLDAFISRFEEVATAGLTDEQLQPVLWHDGEKGLDVWSSQVVRELDSLGPFGAGNPQPSFVSSGCRVQHQRIVGQNHVRMEVTQNGAQCSAIAFGMAPRMDELTGLIDVLYRPVINSWQGKESVQLQIVDVRSSQNKGS